MRRFSLPGPNRLRRPPSSRSRSFLKLKRSVAVPPRRWFSVIGGSATPTCSSLPRSSIRKPAASRIRCWCGQLSSAGWNTRRLDGTIAALQAQIEARRPVLALIEDRPNRYHFVVVVAADRQQVAVHDPAWGPSRRYETDAFVKVWIDAHEGTLGSGVRISIETRRMSGRSMARNMPTSAAGPVCRRQGCQQTARRRWLRTRFPELIALLSRRTRQAPLNSGGMAIRYDIAAHFFGGLHLRD